MKVTVEGGSEERDFALSELPTFSVGIITALWSGCEQAHVGDPIVRVGEIAGLLGRGVWVCVRYWKECRVRPLRKGERIILEGE